MQTKRNNVRGFTLIELMITVLLSAIVIGGVYSLYTVSVKAYRIQDHAIEANSYLRGGLNQLRVDLRSAAFNAPAQSNAEPWVEVLGGNNLVLSALSIEVDLAKPVHEVGLNTSVSPQTLTLLGAYESQVVFRTVRIDGDSVTIDWDQTDFTQADFERVFSANNMVRIEFYGAAKTEQFIPIASATFVAGAATQQISLTQAPKNTLGFGSGHELSVVNFIRYRLFQDTKRDDDSAKYDLIRERLTPNGTAIDGTILTVAEYVVDLQFYDLCFNEADLVGDTTLTARVIIRCYATLADTGTKLDPGANNESHRLRSLKVKLATRAAFEDPNLPFLPRSDIDLPMRAFEVSKDIFGAARVFEASASVFMTSLQARRP